MRRFNAESRDANHKEIVDHVRGHGFEVIETFRPLDCLVFNERAGWMEIKTTARNSQVMLTQIQFMATTNMPVAFVKTQDEALHFAKTFEGITEKQKQNLAMFAATAKFKKYHPAVIERVLNWE